MLDPFLGVMHCMHLRVKLGDHELKIACYFRQLVARPARSKDWEAVVTAVSLAANVVMQFCQFGFWPFGSIFSC